MEAIAAVEGEFLSLAGFVDIYARLYKEASEVAAKLGVDGVTEALDGRWRFSYHPYHALAYVLDPARRTPSIVA